MQIHSRKLHVGEINYTELARSCEDFNGAQCKAVCIEAGMIALRRNSSIIEHEDYVDAIHEIQFKKKQTISEMFS